MAAMLHSGNLKLVLPFFLLPVLKKRVQRPKILSLQIRKIFLMSYNKSYWPLFCDHEFTVMYINLFFKIPLPSFLVLREMLPLLWSEECNSMVTIPHICPI